MTTITVWLLISIGGWAGSSAATPNVLVERFATVEECQRVAEVIKQSLANNSTLRCIQATVIKP
jgi:hypothetical protein